MNGLLISRPIAVAVVSLIWMAAFAALALLTLAGVARGPAHALASIGSSLPGADIDLLAGEAMLCGLALGFSSVSIMFAWAAASATFRAADRDAALHLMRVGMGGAIGLIFAILLASALQQVTWLVPVAGAILLALALTSMLMAADREDDSSYEVRPVSPMQMQATRAARITQLSRLSGRYDHGPRGDA